MARKEQRSKGDRGGQVHRKGWGRWLPIAVLILVAIFIGVGGRWLLARQGNTGSTGAAIQLAPGSQLPEKVRKAPPKGAKGQAITAPPVFEDAKTE